VLENNRRYRNTNPKCEPQLGRRGLYALTGGRTDSEETELAVLWVLNLSDGRHDLLDICARSTLSFPAVARAADALREVGLLVPCAPEPGRELDRSAEHAETTRRLPANPRPPVPVTA
jgi:aminopeptidase-like protein